MFEWVSNVSSGAAGLDRMRGEFCQMLDAGRHVFDAASNALLGGTDLETIRGDLFKTEKRINKSVRHLRREIVVHSAVHGAATFPPCLVLMSIVKDAERIGDYAKNLFDLAKITPGRIDGEWREDMTRLKDRISKLLADCRDAFDKSDRQMALELIERATVLEDHCDTQTDRVIREEPPLAATKALAYRYFKRVTSHVFNVLTSVVQPVDRLDFSKKLPLGEKASAAEKLPSPEADAPRG